MVLGLALLGSVEHGIKEMEVFGDYCLMLLYYFCFWGLEHIFFCSTGFKDLNWVESPGAFPHGALTTEPGFGSGDEHRHCAEPGEAWEGKSPKLGSYLRDELRWRSGVSGKSQMKI